MIPLHDNIPSRTVPVVGYSIIAICSLVFFAQLTGGPEVVERFGMIPARVLHPEQPVEMVRRIPLRRTPRGLVVREERRVAAPSAVAAWLTPLTCIFLHGGWLHILGNLWFLHIFGDNVEDRFGHWGFGVFYVVCGLAASLAHLAASPESTAPTIGASGAIAGVMGAYFVLYPRAMVVAVIPIFIILQMVVLPAPVFLGIWFALQFFQGTLSITAVEGAGVAWWAHIGGFVAGAGIALALKNNLLKPPVETTRPRADHMTHYRVYPPRRRL